MTCLAHVSPTFYPPVPHIIPQSPPGVIPEQSQPSALRTGECDPETNKTINQLYIQTPNGLLLDTLSGYQKDSGLYKNVFVFQKNVKDLMDSNGIRILVDLLTLAHLHVSRATVPLQVCLLLLLLQE